VKASDQLGRWFEDDDALEQALNGEYGLFNLFNNYFETFAQVVNLHPQLCECRSA
jgi:hypothetical protein